MNEKLPYCLGCRDDFYNNHNEIGAKQCWLLKDAKIVTRYRLGWWTSPTSALSFQKVTTLACHHAPGQYVHYKELPEHCREVPA